jgi:hypothetical protein
MNNMLINIKNIKNIIKNIKNIKKNIYLNYLKPICI